jgi:hypothetical protein
MQAAVVDENHSVGEAGAAPSELPTHDYCRHDICLVPLARLDVVHMHRYSLRLLK